jgi:hypothetical protein
MSAWANNRAGVDAGLMSGPPRSGVRLLANSGDVPSPYPPGTQPRRRRNGRGCFHRVRRRGAARRTRRMEPTVEVTLSNRRHRPTAAHPQRSVYEYES